MVEGGERDAFQTGCYGDADVSMNLVVELLAFLAAVGDSEYQSGREEELKSVGKKGRREGGGRREEEG